MDDPEVWGPYVMTPDGYVGGGAYNGVSQYAPEGFEVTTGQVFVKAGRRTTVTFMARLLSGSSGSIHYFMAGEDGDIALTPSWRSYSFTITPPAYAVVNTGGQSRVSFRAFHGVSFAIDEVQALIE